MDASQSEQGGGRDFRSVLLQRSEQILLGIVQSHDHVTVPLCVGSPQDDNLVHVVLCLEVSAAIFEGSELS